MNLNKFLILCFFAAGSLALTSYSLAGNDNFQTGSRTAISAKQKQAEQLITKLNRVASECEASCIQEKTSMREELQLRERAFSKMESLIREIKDEEVLFLAARELYTKKWDVNTSDALMFRANVSLVYHICLIGTPRAYEYFLLLKKDRKGSEKLYFEESEKRYFLEHMQR